MVPELLPDFDNTNEACFVRVAAMHAFSACSTEAYFDCVFVHLKKNSPRHTYNLDDGGLNIFAYPSGVKEWIWYNLFGCMATGSMKWDRSNPNRLDTMRVVIEAGVDPSSE
ncbi:hypothetical protein ANO14919_142040 [Xylariales sp. No.14919]|nr:hypothetical protein ANO14919_142040 [Xylariales sp. No.14919]